MTAAAVIGRPAARPRRSEPAISFTPTYYLKGLFAAPVLEPLVHVHAALFTAWPVLLLVQRLLIRSGKVRLHQGLGTASVALVALMVVTGFMVVMGKPRPTVEARAFIFTRCSASFYLQPSSP